MKSICRIIFSLTASSLIYLASAIPAHAARLTEPGVTVSGSGTHWYKVCSTCPDQVSRYSATDGGNGSSFATTTFDSVYSWFAQGSLTGSSSLPELKAYAEARVPNTIGYVSASSSAQGLQAYHYSGSVNETYTITYSISGLLSGDSETVSAGLNVWGGIFNPFAEAPGTPLGGDAVTATASALVSGNSFSDTRSISFELTPGEDFFITAYLTANAFWSDGGSLAGYADASHTMIASFTGGDTSLLTLNSVPLPSSLILMLTGLIFAVARKQKNSQVI